MDNHTKSKMMAVLAEEFDLDRARARIPGPSRREWEAVLREAAGLFEPKGRATALRKGGGGNEPPAPLPATGPGAEQGLRTEPQTRPVLFTDGASRGNPGPAAAGAAVFLGRDQVGSLSRALGIQTNNQAEYEALILGLELVRELGFDQVSIRADSQLMVRQIQGRYKVKDPKLKPLFGRAKAVLKEFSGYDITHIDRGLNRIADGLANQALDAGEG